MKVLLDHSSPFQLAHGGFQTQIEQTRAGLEAVGVDVEYLRWWDDHQKADIIHYFGRPASSYLELAHKKGIRLVMGELLTGLGSRSSIARALQLLLTRTAKTLLPGDFTARMGWECYRHADACVALTQWERQLMIKMFSADPEKVHQIPNGVEDCFFNSRACERGPWLVCTATVTERKRVSELAQAAILARTPVWIIGKPYSDTDPYGRDFVQLARRNPQWVRYEGAIGDRSALAKIYRQARGFVLLSTMETLSLSALEAAACECPLLLSDLPWARYSFHRGVQFCPVSSTKVTAARLREFYEIAPSLPAPDRPATWPEIGGKLALVYRGLLSTSR